MVLGITYLDTAIENIFFSNPYEVMLNLRSSIYNKKLFIPIDYNYNKNAYKIKYKSKSEIIASKIGVYLYNFHRKVILIIFTSD